jgi:hypothetical protein
MHEPRRDAGPCEHSKQLRIDACCSGQAAHRVVEHRCLNCLENWISVSGVVVTLPVFLLIGSRVRKYQPGTFPVCATLARPPARRRANWLARRKPDLPARHAGG